MFRVTRKRVVVTTVVLLFFAGILAITWRAYGWPPLRLILKYGLPPAGGPTGRRMVIEEIEFIELAPGYFLMGYADDPSSVPGDTLGHVCQQLGLPWGTQPRAGLEGPPRWVEIPYPIWMSRTEITNRQYEAYDPSHQRCFVSQGDDDPVVEVTWLDANAFCEFLGSTRPGLFIRLPAEAEWEYAARAGLGGEFGFDPRPRGLADYAWVSENSGVGMHQVGTKRANAWGLHDMLGNAMEWCNDRMRSLSRVEPASTWGGMRTMRGGSMGTPQRECRASRRYYREIRRRSNFVGFRPVAQKQE